MNLIKKLKTEWQYFGVKKEKRLDYYLQKLVHERTNFEINKIFVLVAEKTRMSQENIFNKFIFEYNKKIYSLMDDNLEIWRNEK